MFGTATPLTQLTLFDKEFPEGPLPEDIIEDERVRIVTGDLTIPGIANEIVDRPDMSVIHLASMVSGNTEQQPELGWEVNVVAQQSLLEALASTAPGARFLFTSSTATLGPVGADEGAAPNDMTKLLPQNTYGFHKAVCELMVNDYSRREKVRRRAIRYPETESSPELHACTLTTKGHCPHLHGGTAHTTATRCFSIPRPSPSLATSYAHRSTAVHCACR